MNRPHTPGPWYITPGRLEISISATLLPICKVHPLPQGEGMVNAYLLAAAPALLEVASEALELIDDLPDELRLLDHVVALKASWRAAIESATTKL